MPRRRRTAGSQSLGGKLAGFRREVERVMESLRREIARRESELSELKGEYGRVMSAFGRGVPAPERAAAPRARRRRGRRRAPALDWKDVYASLPPRFTLATLSGHPKAGKRSKPHLYAIISRWKKEKKISKDAAGGYRKLESGTAAARRRPGRKPGAKPAAKAPGRPEAPAS